MESWYRTRNFSLEELVEAFDLSRVSKSGAKFSPDKTNWFNQHIYMQKTNEELTDCICLFFQKKELLHDVVILQK